MNHAKARRKAQRANRFADHVSEKAEAAQGGQEWDSAAVEGVAASPARVPSPQPADKREPNRPA